MIRTSIAAVLVLGSACAAQADPLIFSSPDPTPLSAATSVYVTTGGGVIAQQLPSFSAPYTSNGRTIFTSGGMTVTGAAGELTIGTKIPGAIVGNNSRLEFSFGGFAGNTTVTGGQGVNSLTVIPSISGATQGTCSSCDGTTILKVNHQEIGGALRLKSDVALGPQWILTPSIGLVGSQSRTIYRSDTSFYYGSPGFAPPGFIDERLVSFRAGGEMGLSLTYQVTPVFSVNAGVAVSLLALNTDLRGNDCMSFNQSSALPCSGVYFTSSVTGTNTRFANRDRFNLAGTYDAGWAKFSASGFATWDSAVAGVTNPTAIGTPAVLAFQSKWGYGGAGTITVPF